MAQNDLRPSGRKSIRNKGRIKAGYREYKCSVELISRMICEIPHVSTTPAATPTLAPKAQEWAGVQDRASRLSLQEMRS